MQTDARPGASEEKKEKAIVIVVVTVLLVVILVSQAIAFVLDIVLFVLDRRVGRLQSKLLSSRLDVIDAKLKPWTRTTQDMPAVRIDPRREPE